MSQTLKNVLKNWADPGLFFVHYRSCQTTEKAVGFTGIRTGTICEEAKYANQRGPIRRIELLQVCSVQTVKESFETT